VEPALQAGRHDHSNAIGNVTFSSRLTRREYDATRDWYDAQEFGLGREFVGGVDTLLSNISQYPEWYAIVFDEDVREAFVKRFPYAIYFREERTRIFVFSVIHTSRNPWD
jgi:hypothetical protein